MSQSNIQKYNMIDLVDMKYLIFNEYQTMYTRPDIRKDAVIRNNMPTILALAMDLRENLAQGGGAVRYVKTKEFLSQEVSTSKNVYRFKTASVASGTAGNPVTTTVVSPYSGNGSWTVPVVGHSCVTNIGGRQVTAYITDVTESANNYSIELTPINGETIDLSGGDYTWQYNPRIQYTESCSSTIQTEGMLYDAPMVIKGNLQKYEAGKHICEDDLDNYAYDFIPEQATIIDPLTNQQVNTWCMKPFVMDAIRNDMLFGDLTDFLFAERDNVSNRSFDGLFATALKRGKMNMPINTTSKDSTLATLKYIAKVYKNDGITDIMLWCDQEMYINLNRVFSEIPGNNNFNLPIWRGSASGDIDWYNFTGVKNFLGIGVNFHVKVLDGWEQMSFTDVYYNFAVIMPMMSFRDSNGNRVPPMEIVKLEKCDGFQYTTENSASASIWYDDARLRGERKVKVYAKNSFGVEFHGAQFLGILSGGGRCF